jgi:hypothetical protein
MEWLVCLLLLLNAASWYEGEHSGQDANGYCHETHCVFGPLCNPPQPGTVKELLRRIEQVVGVRASHLTYQRVHGGIGPE